MDNYETRCRSGNGLKKPRMYQLNLEDSLKLQTYGSIQMRSSPGGTSDPRTHSLCSGSLDMHNKGVAVSPGAGSGAFHTNLDVNDTNGDLKSRKNSGMGGSSCIMCIGASIIVLFVLIVYILTILMYSYSAQEGASVTNNREGDSNAGVAIATDRVLFDIYGVSNSFQDEEEQEMHIKRVVKNFLPSVSYGCTVEVETIQKLDEDDVIQRCVCMDG